MEDQDSRETAKLLKEALTIIDELGNLYPFERDDFETIEELIEKARKLKKNRLWKLK